MLSINTNLSSLIAQNSMSSATKLLNQAVERMTTGYKINHAKDNAANYSISTNMQTQINSYDVAADNVAMGMDLVTTASDIISTMQDHANRLQSLSIQARNGTYGAQSMAAINSEAAAIMAEINRLYNTAEYNNVSLFNRKAYELSPEHQALTEQLKSNGPTVKAEYNGFIEDPKTYTDEEVAAMTGVNEVNTFNAGQKYSISSVEELQKLADYVNAGNDTTGVEFVLGADIDLSSISNWTPIGDCSTNSSYQFKGTFDGNGYVIKNLTIDNETKIYQGLFGRTASGSVIKNIALEGGSIKGKGNTGGLVGYSYSSISNSYATGNVTGSSSDVGGLVGQSYSGTISNSYATGAVSGTSAVGGLVGFSNSSSSITNSYATGNVTGSSSDVGGLVGFSKSSITNSYATGDVSGETFVGGLIGGAGCGNVIVENSCSYGLVKGSDFTGSLVGGFIANPHFTVPSAVYTLNIINCKTLPYTEPIAGVFLETSSGVYTLQADYDISTILAGISAVELKPTQITLQVGINSDSSNQISFDTNFDLNLGSLDDLTSDEALASIMNFQALLSDKATALGAVENRLQSAIESIEVNIENLTSSLSTIRDADIAEVSSEYIRQQILQQASATLLSTANQSPSIALQLI